MFLTKLRDVTEKWTTNKAPFHWIGVAQKLEPRARHLYQLLV